MGPPSSPATSSWLLAFFLPLAPSRRVAPPSRRPPRWVLAAAQAQGHGHGGVQRGPGDVAAGEAPGQRREADGQPEEPQPRRVGSGEGGWPDKGEGGRIGGRDPREQKQGAKQVISRDGDLGGAKQVEV